MRDAQVKLLFWSTAALFGAGAAGVVVWGLSDPTESLAAAGVALAARPSTRPAGPVDPPLAAFEGVWDVAFGQPLAPPAAAPVAATVLPTPPPVSVRVLGTVSEPGGRSMAALAGPDGRLRWCQAGESAAGAEVVRIESDQVTVRHQGATVVLRVERPAAGGAGGRPPGGV